MITKPNDLKLGVFVLASFVILSGGLFGFGAASYFQKTTVVETYVIGNVVGLSVGSPVTLRGVRVGKVSKIDFSWNEYQQAEPRYVLVEFEVRDSVTPAISGQALRERVETEVRNGLRARVNPQGFTGSSLLSLEYVDPEEYPPLPFPWRPHHLYIPSAPGQFGELLTSLQKTLNNVAQVDVRALSVCFERDLDSAAMLMDRLEHDLSAAEKLMGHLDEVNYNELATNADTLVTQLRSDVKAMHLPKVTADADDLLTSVQGTMRRLDLVVANLDAGSLNDALANVRLATQALDDTLRKLKHYPAGFLLGKPPRPVNGLEKTRE